MVNKVLAAFVVTDGLFVAMGAIMLGFSIIVQQTCFDTPNDGNEAARDLLYRRFPFTGEQPRSNLAWAKRKVFSSLASH